MACQKSSQIPRLVTKNAAMRKDLLGEVQHMCAYATKAECKKEQKQDEKKKDCPPPPPDDEDVDDSKPKKISIWRALFGSDKEDLKPKQPGPDICPDDGPDPDLSYLDGKAYKTCGTAYVVQKDRLPEPETDPDRCEDLIVKEMEAEPELKKYIIDPMPPFRNVEQRMMDLDERKLHPLYRKYQSYVPKKTPAWFKKPPAQQQQEYKSRSGPVPVEKVPQRLKLNRELLEKRNLYADFKRVDPPRYLVGKLVEVHMNERKQLQRRHPNLEKPKRPKRESVHDTLRQDETLSC